MAEPFERGGTTYYLTDEEYDGLMASSPMLSVRVPDDGTSPVYYEDLQARYWLADVLGNTPPTPMRAGDRVAMTLARLVGDDSTVTITRRGLTDEVGGPRWFTDDGVRFLEEHGWLKVETIGRGRYAKTTFYLMPGDLIDRDAADEIAA